MGKWLLLMAMLATACDSASSKAPAPAHPTSSETTEDKPVQTCHARLNEMADRIRMAKARPELQAVSKGLELPRIRHEAGVEPPAAPVVELTQKGMSADGQAVADDEALRDLLDNKRELWRSFHEGEEKKVWHVVVAADRHVAAPALTRLLAELSKWGWEPGLLIRVPDHPPIPLTPPAWAREVRTKLRETTDIHEHAELYRKAVHRAIGDCQPAKKALEAVADAPLENKPELFSKGLLEAARACDCRLDVDALEALLIWLDGGSNLHHTMLPWKNHASTAPSKVGGTVAELVHAVAPEPSP